QRVLDRPADVEMERVPELIRLRRLLALPSPAGTIDPMAAERVAGQPGEQVVEHLLADAPAAARRQLQAVALAREVAGLLEAASQLVERLQVAGALRSEQLLDVVPIQPGDVPRGLDGAQLVLERIQRLELADPLQRRLQAEWLVAAELVALAEPIGHQLVHVRR